MLPYLIAGAIGYAVAKLLEEDETPKYADGGSILLAPNGKPSNLTPEQYKLVRTDAFKNWFGDWQYLANFNSNYLEISDVKDYVNAVIKNDDFPKRIKPNSIFHFKKVYDYILSSDENGKIIGALTIYPNGKIDQLAISEKMRGKGIGKKMIDLAIEMGAKSISTHTKYSEKLVKYFLDKTISKVVDENGEPLVVYHGSDINFNIYDLSKIGEGSDLLGKGIYLTENKDVANFYANYVAKKRYIIKYEEGILGSEVPVYENDAEKKAEKHKVIYDFFVKAKKIININEIEVDKNIKEILIKSIISLFGDKSEQYIDERIEFAYNNHKQIKNYRGLILYLIYLFPDTKKEITQYIKNKYDCIIFEPSTEFETNLEEYKNYVVFNPNQIKLADGTNTTFDSSNPDIRYAGGGEITNYKEFFDKLKIENGSKYVGKKFGEVFPFLANKVSPVNFRNSVKQYNGILSRLEKNNYSTKSMKTADLNKLERIKKYIDKKKYLSRFYLDPKGNIISFYNSDNAYAKGGSILLAPNGKPSNLTPEQYKLVRTPEFKAWFGDWENDSANASKVVDENGEPLVVYHGTNEEFNVFKLGYGSYSSFTENKTLALSYGNIINEFFLVIKKPYIINGNGEYIWKVIDDKASPEEFFGGSVPFSNDGIMFKDVIDFNGALGSKYVLDVSNVFMVRKNTQIKLADGTNTTFDGNNPDIRFKNGGELELYHGSEKKFKNFKTNLIDRTDYGWGIYFTDSEDVAKFYARRPFDRDIIAEKIIKSKFSIEEKYLLVDTIRLNLLDLEKSKKTLDKKYHPLINQIQKEVQNKSFVYEANVLNEKWLYWDKKVPVDIKRILKNIDDKYFINGETLYNYLTDKLNTQKNASLFLLDKGINGIKYLITNNITDSNIEGYNYVVFDVDDIQIKSISKYADGGSVLLAPNGKPSNLTPEQYKLVRTPEFKAWFGDWENNPANASKVVDVNGEPLVCYHTTDYLGDINIFKFSEEYNFQQYGYGVYFTDDKKHSEDYFEGENYKVYEVFLNLKNPIIRNEKEKGNTKKYFLINREENNKAGAIIYHPDRRKWNYFIAGEPNQIKLADGTNTTFDGSNPDIRFSLGGEIESYKEQGILELNFYPTNSEHAKEHCVDAKKPLYIQNLIVKESDRLKGYGNKVLNYIDEYAVENGHDVIFGYISQKATMTKDNRTGYFTEFTDIDWIKHWLFRKGYIVNRENNNFHKVIDNR